MVKVEKQLKNFKTPLKALSSPKRIGFKRLIITMLRLADWVVIAINGMYSINLPHSFLASPRVTSKP